MARRIVSTVAEAIEAMGGEDGVHEAFRGGRGDIREWIEREEIPTGWHLRFFLLLNHLGYEVDVGGVFQLRDDGEWIGTRKPLRPRSVAFLN